MDDNLVWALISPRSAIHVARLHSKLRLSDEPELGKSWWLEFPCLGGPDRAIGDVAYYSPDLDEISTEEMHWATEKAGSRGMYCMKPYCEEQRRERQKEAEDVGDTTGDTTVNNNYEGWVDGAPEAWQVMVAICVVVFIVAVASLIWHAVDASKADNVAHQKTLQVKYLACAADENPRFCLQKVQE